MEALDTSGAVGVPPAHVSASALAFRRGPEVVPGWRWTLPSCLRKRITSTSRVGAALTDGSERVYTRVGPSLPFPYLPLHWTGTKSWHKRDVEALFRWQPALKREGSVLSDEGDAPGPWAGTDVETSVPTPRHVGLIVRGLV